LAYLVDSSIRSVVYMAFAIGFSIWLSDTAIGPIMVAVFLVEWFYPVAFEVLWGGKTPGKAVLGLRVIHSDGTPVRFPASLLRNLMMAADFLPAGYAFGVASMLCDRSSRRLGDLAAGTRVVHTAPDAAPHEIREGPAALPSPVALSIEEQRSVIAYAGRASLLSPERAEELAAIAAPLGGNRETLEAIATHLRRGERA